MKNMNIAKWLILTALVCGMYSTLLTEYAPLPMSVKWLDAAVLAWIAAALLRGIRLPQVKDARLVYGSIMLFMMLTPLVALLGLFGSVYTVGETIDGIAPSLRTFMYGLTVWIAYDAVKRGDASFAFIIRSIVLLGLVHFGYAVLQFLALNTSLVDYASLPYQPDRLTASGRLVEVKYSVTGFTDAPFSLASWGGVIAMLCFGLLVHGKGAAKQLQRFALPSRLLLWVGFLTGMGMVGLSYRRTALIACVAAMLLMTVLKVLFAPTPSRRIKGLSAMLGAAVLLASGLAWMIASSEALQHRMWSLVSLATGQYDDPRLQNLEGRSEETWGFWIDLFRQHPLGVGLYPPGIYNVGSDNSYLTYLAQGGIVYALLYAAILVSLFLLGFRHMKNREVALSAYGMALCGLMLYIMITGLGTGGSMASEAWQIRWMLVGAFLAYFTERIQRQSNDRVHIEERSQHHATV